MNSSIPFPSDVRKLNRCGLPPLLLPLLLPTPVPPPPAALLLLLLWLLLWLPPADGDGGDGAAAVAEGRDSMRSHVQNENPDLNGHLGISGRRRPEPCCGVHDLLLVLLLLLQKMGIDTCF